MNSAYYPIVVGVIQFIGTLIYLAWKKGQDDEKLEVLRSAHNDLAKENQQLQDDLNQVAIDLNRLWGWVRGNSGAPPNGGSH